MRALYLLVPLGLAAMLGGCSTYRTVAYTEPAVVASSPYYVAPSSTIVLGAGPAWVDSDGDGVSNSYDRYPYDSRFR